MMRAKEKEEAWKCVYAYLRKLPAYWSAVVGDLQRDLGKSPKQPLNTTALGLLMFRAGGRSVHGWDVRAWRYCKRVPWRAAQNKLRRLRKCINALGNMVRRRDRFVFFNAVHPLLKRRPIDLLDSEKGFRKVMEHIESGASGLLA